MIYSLLIDEKQMLHFREQIIQNRYFSRRLSYDMRERSPAFASSYERSPKAPHERRGQ